LKPPRHPDPHHHTAAVPPGDGRAAPALSAQENADLCAGCVRCCTYITVEVDAPRSPWEYDQWMWALDHETIELYVERPERWFIHVETRCSHLDTRGRCSIHGRHPVLCREYDPRTCERRVPLSEIRAWFKNSVELGEWLQRTRPAHWKRLVAYRGTLPAGLDPVGDGTPAAAEEPELVTIGEVAGGVARDVNGRNGASTRRAD
jgi:Fe-S-cluster containining protein